MQTSRKGIDRLKIHLFNTKSKTLEEFTPVENRQVKIYSCGPTVYARAHIGNLRAYVFVDLLVRFLKSQDYKVKWVMNITDIDDKTLAGAKAASQPLKTYTKQFEDEFKADLKKLNIGSADSYPHATDYFGAMWAMVQTLEEKGFAYKAADGSYYFSIDKLPNYGEFAGLDRKGLKVGARVAQDTYDKANPGDFVLWKKDPDFSAQKEGIELDSENKPSGRSLRAEPEDDTRPGWHLECSVMAEQLLGTPIDIHTGGVDLVFPHHQNEIAQTEAATGSELARFWLHNEHLKVEGAKMAKSDGNVFTLTDIEKRGIEPLALRYLFLSASYRHKLNFTWEELKASQSTLNSIREFVSDCQGEGEGVGLSADMSPEALAKGEALAKVEESEDKFFASLANDLNSAQALAQLHQIIKLANLENTKNEAVKQVILRLDEVLGLKLGENQDISPEISQLAQEREIARKSGDFEKSDEIRAQIEKLGFKVKDTPEGQKISK